MCVCVCVCVCLQCFGRIWIVYFVSQFIILLIAYSHCFFFSRCCFLGEYRIIRNLSLCKCYTNVICFIIPHSCMLLKLPMAFPPMPCFYTCPQYPFSALTTANNIQSMLLQLSTIPGRYFYKCQQYPVDALTSVNNTRPMLLQLPTIPSRCSYNFKQYLFRALTIVNKARDKFLQLST